VSDLTQAQLVAGFRDLGVEGGPATVVAALLETVGDDGTLIAPTFNFGFTQGEPFDARETPSKMGALTEIVRTDPRAVRVPHPIYSFAVIGAHAEEAGRIDDPSSYGPGSLFAKLREWDGKIMVIGLSYNDSMTFFHHVEEMVGCDYRWMKSFTGEYTGLDGVTREYTATMNVRDVDKGVETMVDPMGEKLEQLGAITTRTIGAATVRLMRANEVYELTVPEVRAGGHALHRVVG
jgi:aminoglycoside 3-N-acetyltransferase